MARTARELCRVGRPDDEPAVTERRPACRHHLGDALVQRPAADLEVLQLAAAGVAGAADREHRAAGEQRADGIGAEVWVARDGVSPVAIERLAGVELGGRADVAALGVEDDRHVGMAVLDVRAHRLERRLGAVRGEVGDLRLEGADEVGGGVDDGAAESLDRVGRPVERRRQPRRIGVEPDAQQRLRRGPRGAQLVAEAQPGNAVTVRLWRRGSRRRWPPRACGSSAPLRSARRTARPARGRCPRSRSP